MKVTFFLFALVVLSCASRSQSEISFPGKDQMKDLKGFAECFGCQAVMGTVLEYIEANATGVSLEKLMHQACNMLPTAAAKTSCLNFVVKYIHKLQIAIPYVLNREEYNSHHLCTMINFCPVPCCIAETPEQVHIALAGDSINAVTVSWVTAKNDTSLVYWGTDPSQLSSKSVGSTYTYTSGGWIGMIHKGEMTGLKADTRYYYKVGGNSYGFSPVFTFKTYPSKATSWKFGVIGDMGVDPESLDTVASLTKIVQNEEIDVMIHSGDISYADGYQARWDQYMRRVEPIVANIPYMVCPGNHEIMPLNELGLYGYKYRFLMPGAESGTNSNTHYSWNYGPVHFIALNSESVLNTAAITDEELTWFKNDLEKAVANRKNRPWIVVYLHRPLYCTNKDIMACGIEARVLRSVLEDLFYQNQVDLVITAHKHDYERTTALYNDKPFANGKAPMYVINGAGGNREGLLTFPSNPPSWSAQRVRAWGYGTIEVTQTTFSWKYTIASNGTIADSVSWSKNV